MRLREALTDFTTRLRAARIDEAPLEAEVLLRHALGIDRRCYVLRLGEEVTPDDLEYARALLARRLRHEPLAYVTGQREFYGLLFTVTPDVLIPRPETELLVERALAHVTAWVGSRPPLVADIGTGSGCVAIAIARSTAHARIIGTDVSQGALAIAQLNARQLRVAGRLEWLQGDLLAPLPEPPDIVTANLPYIPSGEITELQPEIRAFEPIQALCAGEDGLALIRRLLEQAELRLTRGAVLLIEVAAGQAPAVADLARDLLPGAEIVIHRDLAGTGRCVEVVR